MISTHDRIYRQAIDRIKKHMDSELVGIDWEESPNAPSTFVELQAQWSVGKLQVSTDHSDSAVWGGDGNSLFRAWHDLGHCKFGLGFTDSQESELAYRHHLIAFPVGSLEWSIVWHDTIGQSIIAAKTGEFPGDQTKFMIDSLNALG